MQQKFPKEGKYLLRNYKKGPGKKVFAVARPSVVRQSPEHFVCPSTVRRPSVQWCLIRYTVLPSNMQQSTNLSISYSHCFQVDVRPSFERQRWGTLQPHFVQLSFDSPLATAPLIGSVQSLSVQKRETNRKSPSQSLSHLQSWQHIISSYNWFHIRLLKNKC